MVKPLPRLRPAIAMIELIFALVIMGIALLSAPLILDMSIKSANTAIQQESVAAASSKISLILTKAWDEQTATPPNIGILDPVTEDTQLQPTNRMTRTTRPAFSMRDYIYTPTGATVAPTPQNQFGSGNPVDTANRNDIDDFHGEVTQLTLYRGDETSDLSSNEGEYIHGQGFDLNTTVLYGKDDTPAYTASDIDFNNPFTLLAAPATSSNIKLITIRLTPNATNLTSTQEEFQNERVTLSAFSCNIGNGGLTISPTEIVKAP